MFAAAIIDQDDTLTHAPQPKDDFYAAGFLAGLKKLVPPSHPEYWRLQAEESFHHQRTAAFYREPCIHAYYAALYGLQAIDVFDQFHLGCEVDKIIHDTASAPALNQLAASGRGGVANRC